MHDMNKLQQYALNNIISCTSLILYYTTVITAAQQIYMEIGLIIWKCGVELYYKDLSASLIMHHGLFTSVAGCVLLIESCNRFQYILVNMHIVHIAFLFRNMRWLTKRLYIYYLLLWPITAIYRNVLIMNEIMILYKERAPVVGLLLAGGVSIFALDVSWTPWKSYRQIAYPRAAPNP